MRLRWLQPLCSQHGYCYLGRRGTQKKANLHTTWKRQSQNSAWAVWFHHHLTNCFSRKTWVSFCLDQQPIGLFSPACLRTNIQCIWPVTHRRAWDFFLESRRSWRPPSACTPKGLQRGDELRRTTPGRAPHPARRGAALEAWLRLRPTVHPLWKGGSLNVAQIIAGTQANCRLLLAHKLSGTFEMDPHYPKRHP